MGPGDNIGNEAAALPYAPAALPDPPPVETPALSWDNVRLGAEPPAARAAGTPELRPVLHDGPAALEALSTIRVTSPRCGHPLPVDPPAIVTRGTGRLAFSVAAPPDLVDDVVRAFQLGARDFDGRTVLTGTNGLAPSFAVLRCDECSQLHLTVVSYGEVQPGRFQLVFEGLAALDDTSAAAGLDTSSPGSPTGTRGPNDPNDSLDAGPGREEGGGRLPTPPTGSLAEGPAGTFGVAAGAMAPDSAAVTTTELAAVGGGVASARPRHRGATIAPPPPLEHHAVGRRVVVIIALVAVAAVVLWVHASTWAAWSRSGDLANTGRATMATVVGTESFDTESAKTFSVSYSYRVVGEDDRPTEEHGRQDVDRATFEQANAARTIEIRYDPADPTRSAIARSDDLTVRYVAVAAFDIVLLAAAWRVWPRLRRYAEL